MMDSEMGLMPPFMRSLFGRGGRKEEENLVGMPRLGMAGLRPESPEKMRRRMDADWENFFREFENRDRMRMIRRKRK